MFKIFKAKTRQKIFWLPKVIPKSRDFLFDFWKKQKKSLFFQKLAIFTAKKLVDLYGQLKLTDFRNAVVS